MWDLIVKVPYLCLSFNIVTMGVQTATGSGHRILICFLNATLLIHSSDSLAVLL